ncbi:MULTISPECIES: GNAT family N-acetyltransferase [Pseudovibrio]|uniref:GNAT family N-acetyltransferase n=1 Tax=Stappiaceae TaxID=2821832 RepID=UPI0023651B1B|nr:MULTISPECIES: GNAT family N-acetyltransferase [Pseudovibrio]MDD7909470.1 GNAT family N-acetyltransferase [Pseudovibrio exalbescens]MDX5595030.1 GNAT family N-acetyltransferase [Pseudovibrio sp. SPO723]
MSAETIRPLVHDDAPALAPLIAENAQALKRGAPRRPDEVYAERLLAEGSAEFLGAYEGDVLVGFALFYDLPDLITGRRIGQLEDIYVMPSYQSKGIGRHLVAHVAGVGKDRDWSHVRWMVPAKNEVETGLYEQMGEPGDKQSYNVSIDRLSLANA